MSKGMPRAFRICMIYGFGTIVMLPRSSLNFQFCGVKKKTRKLLLLKQFIHVVQNCLSCGTKLLHHMKNAPRTISAASATNIIYDDQC